MYGLPSKSGRFFCHLSIYLGNEIRSRTVTIEGWKFMWFSTAITKHLFIYWLALKDRLSTLAKWSYTGDFLFV